VLTCRLDILVKTHFFRASLECRYLVDERGLTQHPVAAFCLHGYGMNPEFMMDLVRPTVDETTLLISIQAPNAFYVGGRPGTGDIGYSWAVHAHSEDSVRVHHETLLAVMGEIEQRYGIGAARRFLLGF
jgi:predicted esterase